MPLKYDPEKHRRHSIRLKDYDYSTAGAYFVTLCTFNRQCILGEVLDGEVRLNDRGATVQMEWVRSAEIRNEVHLDEFVVMPNHLHGIVLILGNDIQPLVGATGGCPPKGDRRSPLHGPKSRSLASFIAGFKAACTRSINESLASQGRLWQRNYYEHVISSENALNAIREYIAANPSQWPEDPENPHVIG